MKHLMKKILYIIFVLTASLYSCTQGYGTAYIRKNLTIYYTTSIELDAVKKLANYWFSHELISDKPQTIRFFHVDSVYQIQLVKSPGFNLKTLNFEAIKNLQTLEDELNKTVFSRINVDVVICDSRFNVINNLNY
jgi:hypothetical protein